MVSKHFVRTTFITEVNNHIFIKLEKKEQGCRSDYHWSIHNARLQQIGEISGPQSFQELEVYIQ